jgi:cytochrome c peroxidase
MRGKPIRVLAAIAAIVVAGFAVAFVSRDDTPRGAAFVDMNHGDVKFAKGELPRVLNAVDTQTAQVANDQLVARGREIFRDPALFEKGETCQTCHAEGGATAKLGTMVHDTGVPKLKPVPVPTPPSDFDGPRDPPALFDLDKTPPYFWVGNVKTIEQAVATPVFGHMAMFVPGGKGAPDGFIDCQSDSSRDECVKQAGDIAAALIAYIKTLKAPESAFDDGTLSPQALRGEKLFQGKGGCIECHGGPDFTDNLVHNTGVPQLKFNSPYRPGNPLLQSNDLGAPAPPPDPGCGGANAVACDLPPPATSAFVNTPQMRDLRDSAPYMHNGVFKTLKEVVDFYNTQSIVGPLNLTPPEVDDLVAYLNSL